ncbi:Cadherin-89D [Frankliniella fusca]|uniref:Cadherin-89D n=1 Tax=Frankliniella fusca TaxID=407009 RepID=A0AAE1LMD3_9NEOP|nr:Cadherin-89D [Frankliniella fusca]
MFYPAGEYLRFVRIPENVPIGGEVLQVEVHPRRNLSLRPVDKADDARYFAVRDVNGSMVSIVLSRTLEDLVDSDTPHNVLKFRLVCDYDDGDDTISSYLSVTVYVEDINDHAPKFLDAPYHVTVDELTPSGLTIFRGIHAVDRDKPNTPNSDVQYSIVGGNEAGKFGLESAHRAALVIRKPLDYDTGDKEFTLTLMASDRGSPPLNSTTKISVSVLDSDDLSPKFTRELYRTQVTENYPLTVLEACSQIRSGKSRDWRGPQGEKVHRELVFRPPIEALDQDVAIDAAVRYDIIAGNERRLFRLDPRNGSLFLERELDLDAERTLPGNTFSLTVQAAQVDNPLKAGVARVEVELLDLNDNLPEFEVDLYNISIVENLPNGFSVLQVMATDKDQGDNAFFTYQLEDPLQAFNIDARTGWLTVRDQGRLDREKQPTLTMRVRAKEKTPSVVRGAGDDDSSSSVNVTVTLLDANDNNPSFVPSNLYEFMAYSDAVVGDVIGQVKAVDPDLGRNGMVLYDVQRTGNLSSSALPFAVDAQTGEVSVADAPLSPGRHALFVEASDQPANPSERRFSLAVISVDVLKAGRRDGSQGEQVPDFVGAPYEFWVGSNVAIGTSVGQIRVTDSPDSRRVLYDLLHSYHEGVPFAVEERSGTITVVADMRKFERTLYDFEAVATDSRDMVLVTNVTIHVVHPEDEVATLFKGANGAARRPMEFRVRENLAGALVGQLLAPGRNVTGLNVTDTKAAAAPASKLRFVIANQQDVAERFAISADGTLYTQRGLDREERDSYRLTVIAENAKGLVRGSGVFQVAVVVEDENDNPPAFDRPAYEGRIAENAADGAEGRDVFALDATTGKLTLRPGQVLDREARAVYHLRVIARDKGGLTSEAALTVHVDDANDNAPRFTRMMLLQDEGLDVEADEPEENDILVVDPSEAKNTSLASATASRAGRGQHLLPVVSVPESVAVGTPLLRLLAEDRDAGENAAITYALVSETQVPAEASALATASGHGHFRLSPSTGEVQVTRALPPESEFHLNVTATDGGGLSDSVLVKIYVRDVNDHAPAFVRSWYTFDLAEGVYTNHVLGRLEAVDADFGANANISYYIMQIQTYDDYSTLPFHINELDGTLTVDGDIDHEARDSYSFQVVAQDHGLADERKRSSVDVEIHVSDINDNPPMFFGYDRIAQVTDDDGNAAFVPVYYASVVENSPAGIVVARVFANDSDFQGNGNGLVLYDIPRRPDREDYFNVDSKDGVVTTSAKLDFETQGTHNVTLVARDLGSPSLSATALLVVSVVDVPETLEDSLGPMFLHRYYEVEVEENCAVPIALLALNVTDAYKGFNLRYSLVPGKRAARGLAPAPSTTSSQRRASAHGHGPAASSTAAPPAMFRVDPRNGTLVLTESPDREVRSRYEVTVRVDVSKKGRSLTSPAHVVYPVNEDRLTDLAPNEVKVVVRVTDVNDNPPRFTVSGRPIVAAIPATAHYGYQIARLQAKDPDEGLNSEVRYQILDRVDDESHKFAVDPLSGQVRSIASFSRDAGRVFGFDVRATDRRGADDGKSAIANVFVYVLDEEKQLVMLMAARPVDVELSMENITSILSNATGMDVRVRKLQPRIDDSFYSPATDLYLYAVDPVMNVIIDMDTLSHMLTTQQAELRRRLPALRGVDLVGGGLEVSRAEAHALSALEVGVVVLGCVVFLGALTAAVCVGCVRRFRHRKGGKAKDKLGFSHQAPLTLHHKGPAGMYPGSTPSFFSLTANTSLVPGGMGQGMPTHPGPGPALSSVGGGGDTTDTYVEMHSNKSSNCNKRRYPTSQRTRASRSASVHHRHQHEPTCTRHRRHRHQRRPSNAQGLHMARSNSNAGFDVGLGSSADSGQILFEERDRELGCCPCGHSPSHSSAESSNGSYEDSLKSSRRPCGMSHPNTATVSRTRHRQREAPQMIGSMGTPLARRQSERVIMCPMQS